MKKESNYKFTSEMMDALDELQIAFGKCADVGLCFYGLCGDLVVYNDTQLNIDIKSGVVLGMGILSSAKGEIIPSEIVETHGSYIDSGYDEVFQFDNLDDRKE